MPHRKMPAVWELLTITFIVAVLAAVFFPVFAARHQPDSRHPCLANEKQLGLAMQQYAQDNDGQLPNGARGSGTGWDGQVYPYVKCVGISRCPDDPTPVAGADPVVSYGINANAARHPALSHYDAPARTVLLFEVAGVKADIMRLDEGAARGAATFSAAADGTDGTLRAGHSAPTYATGGLGDRPDANPTQFADPRHDGGSDFVFADGHVKWLTPGRVSSGSDAVHPSDGQTGAAHGTAAGTQGTDYAATFSIK